MLAPALAELKRSGETVHLVGYPSRLEPLRAAALASSVTHLDRFLADPFSLPGATAAQPILRMDSFFKFPAPSSPEADVCFHQAFPAEGDHLHMAEHLAACLEVVLPETRTSPLSPLLASRDKGLPTIWMHPGAGSPEKRWPLDGFLALAARMSEKTGSEIRFVSGEAEEADADKMAGVGYPIHCPADLMELADMLRKGDLYIGNDTGPTHLAALMGVSTIAIFQTTSPETWEPWGVDVTVISGNEGEAWHDMPTILPPLPFREGAGG